MKAQIWDVPAACGEMADTLRRVLSLPELASLVLASRGYDADGAAQLLDCEPEDVLCDPMLLCDMIPALETIQEAIENDEFICIFGDYDCDGVASTAMLKSYFESIGARSCYYIPHREKEGYGLNIPAIDDLYRMGVSLIITVDNGVSALDEIDHANALGMRVVVTDHHQPRETLPTAAAVVNPHRSDCKYPFKDLSGVGVAFKLLCAMEGERGEELLEQYADFLCIGTVADVVPLIGENRCFVKRGLELLADSHRPGVRALLETAGLTGKTLNGESVAFGLSPRINAAGRLDSAELAAMLLLTEGEEEAAELAGRLESLNQQRRTDEKRITDDIAAQLLADSSLIHNRILLFSGEDWNAGIVGIVCSRMVERFGKPCLLVSTQGENAKGSGRSVEGFSLIEAVTACSDCLTRYGGHPMAAGFSLDTSKLSELNAKLQQFAAEHYPVMPSLHLKIDSVVSPELLTVEQIKKIDCLEPFGSQNPAPVFMVAGARLERIIPLSDGKYCKLCLMKDNVRFNVLCFTARPNGFCAVTGDVVDVAFATSINDYQGQQNVSLKLKGIRLSGGDMSLLVLGEQRYDSYLRHESQGRELIPTREETAVIYRYIKKQVSVNYSPNALYCHIARQEPIDYSRFRIALEVLQELGLLQKNVLQDVAVLTVDTTAARVQLEHSSIIRSLQQQL
ncbi:MAG TPA: single-stranded-DNA-specific exonuclease RecJ [Clostridia bacterium]|nr:single-stranded-DNA-specific exonuclease RecJ [Clostridia bacterium]